MPRPQGVVVIAVRLTGLAPVVNHAVALASPLILRAVRVFYDLDVINAIDSVLASSKRNILLSHSRLFLHQRGPSDVRPSHWFALAPA